MKKSIALLILVFLCITTASAVDHPEQRITVEQARALVMASLTKEQRRLPRLGVEQSGAPDFSKFMFFTVTWEGLPNGSVVVGNYAVDTYTGDVFSATMSCYEEKNRRLHFLQAQVRTTLHLSQSEYQRLKTRGPLCEE